MYLLASGGPELRFPYTGPSASGDTDVVLIYGAQGVRSLTVIEFFRPALSLLTRRHDRRF
jgi:hypothetical protein